MSLDALPHLNFAAKTDKRTSTCESLPPLLCANLVEESGSDSLSADDDINFTQASPCPPSRTSREETCYMTKSSDAATDEMSHAGFIIKPPVEKPARSRPWARMSSLQKGSSNAVDSFVKESNSMPDADNEKLVTNEPQLQAADDLSHGSVVWIPPSEMVRHGKANGTSGPRTATAQLEAEQDEQSRAIMESDGPKRLDSNGADFVPSRSALATGRPYHAWQCSSNEIGVVPGQPSISNELTLHDHGHHSLSGSQRGAVPCRSGRSSRSSSKCTPPNSHSTIEHTEQLDSSKRALSGKVAISNVSVSRPMLAAPSPPPSQSEMVVMKKDDAKGSGLKYNLVQFKATPTLSTSCDSNKPHPTPRAPRSKSKEVPEVPQAPHPKDVVAPRSASDDLSSVFEGWSRRDVKQMLRGTYSPDEIAEVLQVLKASEPRRARRSRSKQSPGLERE
eukprot:TRINITY_DN19324_c0_g1_i1.p1 TRINITY_DN19324_c0_g1~~TRINITY_DN19324_c0_g1_i1.p1  ORF type:complete len:464 (+),score=40.64 TRINITY_DN19324_c0_g1_i1:51-1394(+)